MKEALKFLDSVSFDSEDEIALANVAVSDAQYAIRLALIEELNNILILIENKPKNYFSTPGEDRSIFISYLKTRIETLQSKHNKLNEPV